MKHLFALVLILSLAAQAQDTPTPETLVPRPSLPDPAPSIQPSPPYPAGETVIRGREVDPNALAIPATGNINEANITALEAAQIYEDHSGKRVIMSHAVAQSEVSFTMRGPLSNAEVAKFLKLTLLAEGLAMIPIPGEPQIVRLVPSGPITSVSAIPKDFYTDQYNLPVDDQLVSYQMPLNYLKPEEALRILQSSIGQLSASGNISAVPNASSLIITENSSLIRQMIKIKNAIDVPTAVGEKWVDVTYGDVDQIAEQMNEIYNNQSNSQQATRTTRAGAPPNPGGNARGAAAAGEEIPIRIIGVRRTSRILLVGRPSDLIAAEAMVKSFDQPSSGKTRRTFRLRYLRVGDFLPIAESAISITLGESASGQGGGGGRPGGAQSSSGQNRGGANNNQSTGNQGGGAGGNRASIQEQDIPTAPESMMVGSTLLVGDNVANTIIVNGPPHHIELVRDLIADLDSEPQQVVLSAVIGSYGITDGLNFGVDLGRAIGTVGGSFMAGGVASFANGVITPSQLDTLRSIFENDVGSGSGFSAFGEISDDFGFFVNALETETRFKTLERTVLTTRNNRVATLSSGQRIAIPSSTFQGGTATGQTTNVEFRDVTLELQIQPLINSDNQITLEISLVRDAIGADRTIDGTLVVPDINTEQLTTTATVNDGAAVVLGGIITTTDRKLNNGIPILSRIPGIGRIFGRNEDEGVQSELIIMIQPKIVRSQAEFSQFTQDYADDSEYAREVVDSFPRHTRLLPAQGEISGQKPVPSRREILKPMSEEALKKKPRKSKIRRKTGRPGR